MRLSISIVAAAVLAVNFNAAFAAECSGGPPPKPRLDLKSVAPALDAKADAINAWWTEGRGNLELSQAITERQARIDRVYEDFAKERKALYASQACTFVSRKKCSSTSGRRRTCPVDEAPPSSKTQFDVARMEVIGDDFDQSPTLQGGSISYIVKKTGSGSNTGGFNAPVVFTAGAINQFVEEDVELVRSYFQQKVALSNPKNVVVGGNAAGPCASVAADIAKLAELHKSGALTEAQYQSAVLATLNACK